MPLRPILFPLAALAASLTAAGSAPRATPYARRGPLEIRSVSLPDPPVPRYGRLELRVELSATYDNPFDPDDVRLDAEITAPSGRKARVPGFLHRAYTRSLVNGKEVLEPAGEPSWRLRYAPSETGEHGVRVTARDRTGTATRAGLGFRAAPSGSPGFIRRSPRDSRFLEFDSGRPYYPVGANVCWGGDRGTYNYDHWLAAYSGAGCNFARLWLSPQWTTFALERAGKPEEGLGMGQFDLAGAWRLDHVLADAERRGLYLMLCIDSYNILREKDAHPQWELTPHNRAHGGPLARPDEFWTSLEMDRLYRAKLRYLVARYGASPHVLAWEFWNEADLTTGYRSDRAREWHARMAAALRDVDPYDHLLATSFSRSEGDRAVDSLEGLDLVQTHHYGSPDPALTLAGEQARKAVYGRPHFAGEIGADAGGPRGADDPEGLQIHDPLWVSAATGASGAAQPWWWDSYIHPRGLYGLFTPLVRFVKGVDWPGERFRPLTPRVEWARRPEPLPRGDLALRGGPVSWTVTEYNRPRTVRVTRAGASGELPLAGIQHGTGNHPDKHNPATFETDLPWPVRFEVEVGDVSGYGGAALRVTLDGRTVLSREFADPDPGTDTLRQHAGRHGVEIPAGKHRLVVENPGADWFMAGFRFRGALERAGPPLLAWATAGKTTVLAWARLEERTWQRVCALKEPVPPAPASVLVLPGVAPGAWSAEVWDTWRGRVLETGAVRVGAGGMARVRLPAVERDLAVKLRRK